MVEFIDFMVPGAALEHVLGANFGYFIGPVALFTLIVAVHFYFWRKGKLKEAKISKKELKKGISKLDRLAKKTKDN